jgi:hypothetical protein
LLDGVAKPPGTLVHILEAARVRQEVADPRIAVTRQVVSLNPPCEQKLVDQLVHPEPKLRRSSPTPWLAGDRIIDVECGAHSAKLSCVESRV